MGRHNNIDANGLTGFGGLAIAVVEQAVMDWRYLCSGGIGTVHINFSELETFFVNDCDTYLAMMDTTAEEILSQLLKERRSSGLYAERAGG